MTQYIDKSTVVAKIEKLINDEFQCDSYDEATGFQRGLDLIRSFVDTLEVKEVDFETAFAASIDHFDEKNNYGRWPESDLRQFAKHFFELGLKTQKRE